MRRRSGIAGWLGAGALLLGLSACEGKGGASSAGAGAQGIAPRIAAEAGAQGGANEAASVEAAAGGAGSGTAPAPELVTAPDGPVDVAVREALAAAEREGRRLLVYVGASWCEPCEAFRGAVQRGELDDALPGVRLLVYDSDHAMARLDAAGYGGRMIPRFVVPGPDGRGTDRRIEGGLKGEGAVADILERLQPLLVDGAS